MEREPRERKPRMATDRQELMKAGTLEGAVNRLAALRPEIPAEAVENVETVNIPIEPEEITELEAESPLEEVAPTTEVDDIFADDLDEVVETHTLEAPSALSKEGKELFANLAPELQKEVSERIKAAERGATQKVQQVAQKEKELEAQAQEILRIRDEWNTRLQSLDATLPEPPDPDLADINSDKYDPDAFNVQIARYERAKLTAEKQRTERQKLADENSKIAARQQQEMLRAHADGILRTFPSWSTQEKFSQGVSSVQDFLASETGIPLDEARKITNPAFIKIGYMARQYKQAKEKVRASKAPAKASAPTGRTRTQPQTSISEARQSLKDTGSIEAAVAVLSATSKRK